MSRDGRRAATRVAAPGRAQAGARAAEVAPPPPPPAPTDRGNAIRYGYEALQAGEFEAARDLLAPAMRPDDLELLLLYGLALGGSGDAEAAAPVMNEVSAARPTALHPCLDLVGLLSRQYRAREAEPVFLACLALTPDDYRLRLGYAQHLYELFRFDEALEAVEESLRLQPGFHPSLNQRAIILVALGRTPEALGLFRTVVAEDPRNGPAWANIGCTLAAEGEFDAALLAYRESIQLRPTDAQVRLNHSICLLKAGRMVQGWHEHEWRLKLAGHTELPLDRMLPNITQGTDLEGKSILVTHEEGIGDTLMYLRYVPLLARLGARVILWVPSNLARLAAGVEGVAGIIVMERIALEADWHCPFISLPRAFAGTQTPWGVPAPYLKAHPTRVEEARRRLQSTGRGVEWGPARDVPTLRVGLVWGGAPRPQNLPANAIDRKRSMSLQHLAPLAALKGVQLVSLQFGPYARQLHDPPEGLMLVDPMETVLDIDDTASLMGCLDVVVSVDTSMVHLAGGLGLPVILMDRYDNCWRWFHGRDDSPWYPGLRIVRQTTPGDWDGVVARVLPMLEAMAEGKRRAA